ncbi:MAG TPA: TrkA family potassium uptake protein [Egicoccus sp.]|nr:TrkA family potassium uptake protein [Egicoccus sp.]HSK23187.1 TrkA family potassium uptake protein [Egicoccus sp.]
MRRVMIIGGGQVGTALARRLVESGHEVTVVERSRDRCEEVAALLPQVTVGEGDGTDGGDLERHGVRGHDVLVAVTGADPVNALSCALARFNFAVPRTVARLVDPAHAWLLDQATGVDIVLDQTDLLARLIAEELSLGEVETLVRLRRGDFSLVEERVAPGAGCLGRAVTDLAVADGTVVAVFRGPQVFVPSVEVRLREDDEVLAIVPAGHGDALAEALATRVEPG